MFLIHEIVLLLHGALKAVEVNVRGVCCVSNSIRVGSMLKIQSIICTSLRLHAPNTVLQRFESVFNLGHCYEF